MWAGANSKPNSKTFDQLRVEVLLRTPTPKSINVLPPTSSVLHGHIKRAFYCVRKVLCLLDVSVTRPVTDSTKYGWVKDNDTLLPDKCLKPLPQRMLVVCMCTGTCGSTRCVCKKAGVKCVIFCHKQESTCQNM